MSRRWFLLATLLALSVTHSNAEPQPRIAIIIDDLGYQLEAGRRAIMLPGPVAFAILPNTPHSKRLAQFANDRGKDVLLHLPLEAVNYRGPAEPGGITLDMTRQAFRATFAEAMETVPFAVGVSSHRGSLLTRHPGHMSWLMDEIADNRALFFVDSYTTADSVALHIAFEKGVPAVKRDVFLDPDPDPATLQREFARLKALADKQGFAVGIGHPYPTTLDFLESALEHLQADGYELVAVRSLVDLPAQNAAERGLPAAR